MPRSATEREEVIAQTGRVLGPRARRTRARLLEATRELLLECSVLDISVVDIARRAETSAATFYHYFKDVDEATLELARDAADEMPALHALVEGPWEGDEGLETARAVAGAFIDHWQAHHAVLVIRNLAADRGDTRFQEVRRRALKPLIQLFADRVEESRKAGRVAPSRHPYAAGAALVSLLETLSAHTSEIVYQGVGWPDLVETAAGIVYQVVTGRPPA